MKRFKLILKGVLLWVTAFAVMLFISGVDSLYDNEYFFQTLIVVIAMCCTCLYTITEEEYKIVSGYNLLNKILKLDENKLDED